MPNAPLSVKFYRWLLRLYPASFLENYGGPMEQEFRDELSETRGFWALTALWVRLFGDLAVSIPRQLSREVYQDARHTLRLWTSRPLHTGFAITALAIGIGASTGMFSVVDALLLRSLPFYQADRLAILHEFIPPHDTAKEFHDWRQQSTYLSDTALIEDGDFNLGGANLPARVHAAQTSWNFFALAGVQPILGRSFLAGEDIAGRDSIAVISYGLWQQIFAGDPRVLGKTIRLDGMPLTVIGVAPPRFDYPNNTALWKAATFSAGNNGWQTIARLRPKVSWRQATGAFTAEAERRSIRHQGLYDALHPKMTSLRDGLVGPVKSASLLLMAGVLLILLIACANVANLMMARTADRVAEISIRSALGASRTRIAQQLLTECLLLSLVAAAIGFLIAYWTTSLATRFQPPPTVAQSYSILNGRVLSFVIVISVVSASFFGIVPSVYAGRIHAFGTRSSGRKHGARLFRDILTASQVALTIILFTASISLGHSFLQLMRVDRGYDVNNLVTVNVSLGGTARQLSHTEQAYTEEVLSRIRALPNVQCASATDSLPLYATGFGGGRFGIDGRPALRSSTLAQVQSDYFQTMGGQILFGREFTAGEVRAGARVAVVNERFASAFGPPQAAVGRQLTIGNQPPWKILGVVRGMEYETDPTTAHGNQVFAPGNDPGSFVVRTDGRAEDHLAQIRDTIRSVDPQVPIFSVKTMEQRLYEIFSRPRFYRTAIWIFAGFAILLAMIGIYGMVSYAVVQRTQEMGVRLALGTTPNRLRGMLLRQGLLTVAVGAIPGIIGASLSGRYLASLMDGTGSPNFTASLFSVSFIFLIASASIWSATRRVAKLDIVTVLRAE